MNGKDLFDAINGVKKEYLDEVAEELVRDSERLSEEVSYEKKTGSPIARVLPWVAAVAVIAVLFTVAAALHQRNRKPGEQGQTPAGEATPSAVPPATETTPTAVPTSAVTDVPKDLDELKNCEPYELYKKSLSIATPEQETKLEGIHYDLYFGYVKEMYTRKILTIMGAIPEDAPYLTLDDANRLIAEMKAEGLLDDIAENLYSIRARFNAVATAPDVDGGSGFQIIFYAVDAEPKAYVAIHSGGAILYCDGEETAVLYQQESLKDPENLPPATKEFSMVDYAGYWSDETIRERVHETIKNYTFVLTVRSDFGYAPENQELYDRLAVIDGAAPYILRYVLERDNSNGDGCDAMCVAVAADLLGRPIAVDDEELPDGFLCSYMFGTPKFYAARLVAAENK